jgi:hypothetical protein
MLRLLYLGFISAVTVAGLNSTSTAVPNVGTAPAFSTAVDPDVAWEQIMAQTTATSAPAFALHGEGPEMKVVPARKKTAEEVAARKAYRRQLDVQTAQSAGWFYQTFPQHGNASAARKLEAICGLRAVSNGSRQQEQNAIQLAKAYRDDPANPRADRFDVAFLLERVQNRGKSDDPYSIDAAALEPIVTRLQTQFSDEPKAYFAFMAVARAGDRATAVRMAKALQAFDAAPEAARREAARTIEREAAVGKPLSITLTTFDGKPVALTSSGLTVLYVWSVSPDPDTWPGLSDLSPKALKGLRVVYLNISHSGREMSYLADHQPVGGSSCMEETGGSVSLAAALYIPRTPYVLLVDETGLLRDFGPAEQLSTLLANNSK